MILDEVTARLLDARFELDVGVAGSFILRSERAEYDPGRPLLGRPTPCVGREREFGVLEGLFFECRDEAVPHVVLVTAPPGVGKSRLRHELLRRVERRSEPLTILLGRGDLLSAGVAYGMLGRAIRRLCGLAGSEPPEVQRERLHQRIGEHLAPAEQERVRLFIGELCGIHAPADESPLLRAARQDPKGWPERLRRAALDWLAAECQAAPVLLVQTFRWLNQAPPLMTITAAPGSLVIAIDESDEFHRQSRDMKSRWESLGYPVELLIPPGLDHFNVVNDLADPDCPLVRHQLDQMKLAFASSG